MCRHLPVAVFFFNAMVVAFSASAKMPSPLNLTDTTTVDLIELNHCYRQDRHTGKVTFAYTQVIFWADRVEPTATAGLTVKLRVMEYRVFEGEPAMTLTRGASPSATWTEHGRRRHVTARLFTESWTLVNEDPELLDNRANPRQHRLALFPKHSRPYLAPEPQLAMNDR